LARCCWFVGWPDGRERVRHDVEKSGARRARCKIRSRRWSRSQNGAALGEQLDGKDVSFPRILSDDASPTTALAAVKTSAVACLKQDDLVEPSAAAHLGAPPPATDRLRRRTAAGASARCSIRRRDHHSARRADRFSPPARRRQDDGELAPKAAIAAFSYRSPASQGPGRGDKAVEDLRKRGHRAFRQAATCRPRLVAPRAHRPLQDQAGSAQVQRALRSTERIAPFLIDPEKVKQPRAARGAAFVLQKRHERVTGDSRSRQFVSRQFRRQATGSRVRVWGASTFSRR